MRAFDRDLIRAGHYGQRSCETAPTGRTHGCTDQRRAVKILLANSEPSTHGSSRHFAAAQQFGRIWSEADINHRAEFMMGWTPPDGIGVPKVEVLSTT